MSQYQARMEVKVILNFNWLLLCREELTRLFSLLHEALLT